MVERNHVGGAFVLKEVPIHFGHFRRTDEVDGQLEIADAKLLVENLQRDAAEQGSVDAADALAVANGERPAHFGWPRCSS